MSRFDKELDVSKSVINVLAMIGMFAGFASIIASILIWFAFKTDDRAHAERFGIFVGLWAPTFFILSGWVGSRCTPVLLSSTTTR